MKRKALTQKNTLLKNEQANAKGNFFKRVFFSPTQEKIQIIFFSTLRFFNYLFSQRTVLNWTDTASIVGNFGQSVCKLDTTHLWTDRRATDNKGFAIAGVPCFTDTFVQGRSSVLRMKFSAKTPRHRKPPKRWQQVY